MRGSANSFVSPRRKFEPIEAIFLNRSDIGRACGSVRVARTLVHSIEPEVEKHFHSSAWERHSCERALRTETEHRANDRERIVRLAR
jgi:hypothetical protein